jgi:hypothetical protein
LWEPVSYPFEALVTNLPASVDAVDVRRDVTTGVQTRKIGFRNWVKHFGIKRLCVQYLWGTGALYHLSIAAHNFCVLLQRQLGQLGKCELHKLRWRLCVREANRPLAGCAGRSQSGPVAENVEQTHRAAQLPCGCLP